jgi:hypothetical protein
MPLVPGIGRSYLDALFAAALAQQLIFPTIQMRI